MARIIADYPKKSREMVSVISILDCCPQGDGLLFLKDI